MNCEECNNQGYTLQPDYQHDVMMRVQCVQCLAHENMKMQMSKNLSQVFIQLSPSFLAKLLADTMIGILDKEENPDYARLDVLVAAKNKDYLVAWLQVMA